MARLGANVVGVDSNSNSYQMALSHLENYQGTELNFMK